MSSLRRAVPVKSSVSTLPAVQAEPGERITFVMLTLNSKGKLAPYGTVELELANLGLITEAIESAADSSPKISVQMGRPGTRLLVTAVNKADPNFPAFKLELGEVVTVPEVVDFFVKGDTTGDKTSAPLIRYYLKRQQPFVHRGYTFRAIEDFKRDLNGPAAKDFYELANIHAEWCKANRRTPFE